MKKLITLAFCLYVMPGLFAQNTQRYDSNSPWFLGFNVGAAWNSTDVKNETNAGWGLTFGRSLTTRPDALFSWDLRLRYLQGNWYGQDFDTTDLSNYDPEFMPNALQAYKDNPGYTVNNFSARNHHLGVELVLHANRLRQRTGWDPYIFGGANIVWNQTFSDLSNIDTAFGVNGGQYVYDPDIISDGFLGSTFLDGVYETAMNPGSVGGDYNLEFMPSIGVGLAYYFGPRFALGIEHKSTFTRKDDWDGYIDDTPGLWNRTNDIYHYTSGFLRFHLRGSTRGNTNNTTTNNNIAPCPDPLVVLQRPSVSGTTVENQVYAFRARIDNINSVQNVRVRVNGVESTNFFYSTTTNLLEGSIVLNEGANQIQVVATNSCGTDTETIAINYDPCRPPIVRFTDPSQNSINVETPTYRVRASIANGGNINYTVNGVATSNFFYQQNTGSFESTVNLVRGLNTITITTSNECGSDTETISIVYTDCEDPRVNFLSGNGSVINVTDPFALIRATIFGIDDRNAIGFRVNGNNRTFNYNAGSSQLEANVSLTAGANVIQITVGNDCGTDIETMTVNYTPCRTPQLSILTPIRSGSINIVGTQLIEASVTNATNVSQIQMLVNGVNVAGGNYNPATRIYSNNAALNAGTNVIQIIVTNACGSDSETTNVLYEVSCPLPMISLASTISNAHQSTMPIEYVVQNVISASQIQLRLNGVLVQGGFFNNQTNVFSATLSLAQGANTITINASNNCGADSETIVVYFTPPCDDPTVAMINPIGNQLSVSTSQFDVQAILQNITNANQVELSVNGATDMSGSYSHITQVYHNTINLQQGLNTVIMTVDNGCGVETEVFVIDYSPCLQPVVSINSPTGGSTLNENAVVSATILNVENASDIEVIVNGIVYSGSYNSGNGAFSATVPLNAGNNTIQVIATNECGSISQSVCISYSPCTAPTVQFVTNTRGLRNSQTATVQAAVTGVSAASEITATHNGNTVQGTYNAQTNMYAFTVTLTVGLNTFTVTASNDCGSDSQSTTLTYVEPCDAPQVSITSPSNGTTAASNSVQLSASVLNITNVSEVQLVVNGSVESGNLNTAIGIFTANIMLQQGANTIQVIASNSCGSATETITVLYQPCLEPTVQLIAPTGGTTQNPTTTLQAIVLNVASANEITLSVNGSPVSGSYNAQSNTFTATISLVNGINNIVVQADNDCGHDSQSVGIQYDEPCNGPQISIATPLNASQVATNSVQLAATVVNVANASGIELLVNDVVQTGTFNTTTGAYSATIALQPGTNTIEMVVTNECGSATETVNVIYSPCVTPGIQIVSPLQTATTSASANLQAVITGVSSASDITATLNGASINGSFDAVTNTFTAPLTLINGSNTIEITATNNCGADSHVRTIRYDEPCNTPQIVFNSPANGVIVEDNSISITATLTDVTDPNQVQLLVNGTSQQGTFNASTGAFNATVTLHQGVNAIVISAGNDCGTVQETLEIIYQPCSAPTLSIISPASGVSTTQNVTITAEVKGVESASGVSATFNGTDITGTYDAANNSFTLSVTLATGSNVIVINARNECGVVDATMNLAYDAPCEKPTISITSPIDGSETGGTQVKLVATILNITDASDVEVYVNGQIVSGGAYDASQNQYVSTVPVDQLINKITVYASNDCGRAEEKVIVGHSSEPTMVICYHPNGNGAVWEQMEIPVSEWPQYQAQGATQGECRTGGGVIDTTGTGYGSGQQGGSSGGTQTGVDTGGSGGGLIPMGGGSNTNGSGTTGTGSGTTGTGGTGGTTTGGGTTGGGTTGGGTTGGGGESGNGGRSENGNGSGTIKAQQAAQEAATKKAAQEAAAKKAAQEAAAKKAAQEAAAKKAAQEAAAKKAAQQAATKKAAQEAAAKKAAQEAAAKKAAQEAAAKKAAQEAAAKKAAQEAATKKAAQEAAAKKAAQEAAAKKAAQEAATKKAAQEAAAKKAAQEAAAKKAAQQAAAKKAAQQAAAKKAAQEAAAKKAAQEAAAKKAAQQAAAKKAAQEAAAKKAAQEAAAKKAAAEEAAKKKAEEEKAKKPAIRTPKTTEGGGGIR